MSLLLNARLRLFEKMLGTADRLATALGRTDAQAAHLRTGVEGEEAAFFYLRRLGFVVTARGWRSAQQAGDLDLVAWENQTLCFIEVKTRSSHAVASAEAAVDEHKRRTLRRLARAYMRSLPQSTRGTPQPPVRFDILSIYIEKPPMEFKLTEKLQLEATGVKDSNSNKRGAAEYQLFRSAFGWS